MTVVGVAIRRERRVLVARRTVPIRLAGRWELPGGKVAPGESLEQAGVREVAEELGCEVAPVGRLPGRVPLDWPLVLHVVVADLVDGEPVPREHDALRWLASDQLDEVGWLESDRPFLDALRGWLLHPGRQDPPLGSGA